VISVIFSKLISLIEMMEETNENINQTTTNQSVSKLDYYKHIIELFHF
jgi:hypothetical protein